MTGYVPPYLKQHRRRIARDKFLRDYEWYLATFVLALMLGFGIGVMQP